SADNIIVTGTMGTSIDLGGGALPSLGGQDIFVVKYSASGGHLWSKSYGETSGDCGFAVAVDANNNIFIGGVVGYGAIDFGGGLVSGVGMQNSFVLKLSANGAYTWARRMTGAVVTDSANLRSLAVDSAGDVIAAGYFSGAIDFGGGRRTCANGSGELFLAKYSGAGGVYRWDKIVQSTRLSGGYGVAADASN